MASWWITAEGQRVSKFVCHWFDAGDSAHSPEDSIGGMPRAETELHDYFARNFAFLVSSSYLEILFRIWMPGILTIPGAGIFGIFRRASIRMVLDSMRDIGRTFTSSITVASKVILQGSPERVTGLAELEARFPYTAQVEERTSPQRPLASMYVPLVLNGSAFACLGLRRFAEVPFSDEELALIEAFADQAVIAIENVH